MLIIGRAGQGNKIEYEKDFSSSGYTELLLLVLLLMVMVVMTMIMVMTTTIR